MNGSIISGEFDEKVNIFSIKRVKNFETQSIINQKQAMNLYQYLKNHEGDSHGHLLTLYDQLLVPLSQDDVKAFIQDLEAVQSKYYS